MDSLDELKVSEDEKIIRYILSPKHIDVESGELIDNFITLRQEEDGVSCIRFEILGSKESAVADGNAFAEVYNRPKKNGQLPKNLQSLFGWGYWTANQILDLNRDIISLSVDPSRNCHVLIKFNVDGDCVKGLVKDASILELFDMIQDVMRIEKV